MRITGGRARGIPLVTPPGETTRPATDQMRQAVFSSLGDRVEGARFIDLFAGTGAYGLEALSRGAAGGVFVETHPRALACLRQNRAAVAKSLGRELQEEARLASSDALRWQPGEAEPIDLIFVDPPYDGIAEWAPRLFARFALWLAERPDALVLFEMPGELTLEPDGWTCLKRLGKGARQPTVAVYRQARAPGTD